MRTKAPALTDADRERLMALGQDLARAWESPGTTPETRKKIIRTVISEIIVDIVGDKLELVIHWQGGDHTRLTVKRNRAGQTRWTTDAEVVDLVRALGAPDAGRDNRRGAQPMPASRQDGEQLDTGAYLLPAPSI